MRGKPIGDKGSNRKRVWAYLTPEQAAWLDKQPAGKSETIRTLIEKERSRA